MHDGHVEPGPRPIPLRGGGMTASQQQHNTALDALVLERAAVLPRGLVPRRAGA